MPKPPWLTKLRELAYDINRITLYVEWVPIYEDVMANTHPLTVADVKKLRDGGKSIYVIDPRHPMDIKKLSAQSADFDPDKSWFRDFPEDECIVTTNEDAWFKCDSGMIKTLRLLNALYAQRKDVRRETQEYCTEQARASLLKYSPPKKASWMQNLRNDLRQRISRIRDG